MIMDIYGYISLHERLKRRKAQMVKQRKAAKVYNDLHKWNQKSIPTPEERASDLNRREDKRFQELKRHLEHEQLEYGRTANKEQVSFKFEINSQF